jgi:multiple sugar transport system substrate-binding protein
MLLLSVVLVLSACSNSSGEGEVASDKPVLEKKEVKPPEPITLKVFTNNPQAKLDVYFSDELKKKFPNVTFQFEMSGSPKEYLQKLQQDIAANDPPDLLTLNNGIIDFVIQNDILQDLTPFMTKEKVDVNRLRPGVLDSVKAYSTKNEVLAMPMLTGPIVIIYNKNIFDKFGVAYPKDDMTWDQMYDLARKVTRTDNGVAYRGFDYMGSFWLFNQLGLPLVDAKTGKSVLTSDGWMKWVKNFDRFFQIPGNEFMPGPTVNDRFIKDKNTAMLATSAPLWDGGQLDSGGINWDMVTLPAFADHPGVGAQLIFEGVGVAKTSKYKDQAFQVVNYLISNESQQSLANNGYIPIINDKAILSSSGKANPFLKGKNTQAMYKMKFAPIPPFFEYNPQARAVAGPAIDGIMAGNADAVTGLRTGAEQIDKAVSTAQSK